MKENCCCGFIIEDPRGILLCHPTNAGNRWDLPKGWANPREDHLIAAKRELHEETGIVLPEDVEIIDYGQHPYQPKRDLHLFHVKIQVETRTLHCSSMVINPKGSNFPEVDGYGVFSRQMIFNKVSPRIGAWLLQHAGFSQGDSHE